MSARAHLTPGVLGNHRPAAAAAAALMAVCLTACGATPPQLSVEDANRVASALSGITEACGEAYQRGPWNRTIEAAAMRRSQELARAYTGNAQRIYQSQTMQQIIAEAVSYLRGCRLRRPAASLEQETSR